MKAAVTNSWHVKSSSQTHQQLTNTKCFTGQMPHPTNNVNMLNKEKEMVLEKHPKLCILSPGLEIHWCDQGEATGWNAARSSLCHRCSSHCVDTSRADCTALRPLPSSPGTQCEVEAVPHTPRCQWNSQLKHTKWKSAQRDASTALAVVRPKIFTSLQNPFPGARDGQHLIS